MKGNNSQIELKELFKPLQDSMRYFSKVNVRKAIESLFASDANVHMCYPFGNLKGSNDFF